MANDARNPMGDWLVQVCPSCGDKVCLPAAVAARGGNCPRCHAALSPPAAPPAPRPAAARPPEPRRRSQPQAVVTRDEEADDEPVPRARRRRPPAPEVPSLWQGTFSFPWLPKNLRAWILFGIGCSMT